MTHRTLRNAARCIVVPLCVVKVAGAQQPFQSVEDFLTRAIGLNGSQISALARGEVVDKLLPTGDDRDVAVFATVNVAVPRSFFVERQRDYSRALRVPTRVQVHVFDTPATLADVQGVDVNADDVKDLEKCQPNDCNFKLPAADMQRLRTDINLAAPDASARVASYVRQRMLDYVADYRRRGNDAMVVYDDLGSVHSSEALTSMLRDSSFEFRASPALGRYLTNFPRDTLAGATHVIFWSLDELPHVRRVLRITDETIYSPSDVAGATIVAAKQIYANHYFEAGLELLTAVDRAPTGSATGGITLLAIRRYRFDHLPGGGLLNIRGRVVGGLRENTRSDLTRLKSESEMAFRVSSAK